MNNSKKVSADDVALITTKAAMGFKLSAVSITEMKTLADGLILMALHMIDK